MHEPELYHNGHKAVKFIVGQNIREYFRKLKWRADGCDILMDTGSGPGDVFMNHIYPQMPQKFHKIICSDISKDMLEFANRKYGNTNKLEYRVLDIATTTGMPYDLRGTIDHLTSILCLHWVENIEASVNNMYDLMRSDGGDCLIILMPSVTIFDAYDLMRNSPIWANYKKAFERFTPPLHYSEDPKEELKQLLTKAGFKDIIVKSEAKLCSYESFKSFNDEMKSVCGVLESIPSLILQTEFLDELLAIMMNLATTWDGFHERETKYSMGIKVLTASARKV